MNVKIRSIADQGIPEKERLVLSVLADTDIGDYLVLRTKAINGQPTSRTKDVYWFPDEVVKGGDLVVLYTKFGIRSTKVLPDGSKAHFFYWGKDGSLWEPGLDMAVLIYADDWTSLAIE